MDAHMEDKLIFKSYLRRLLHYLKDIKLAIANKEYEKADELVDELIEDTQKDIED